VVGFESPGRRGRQLSRRPFIRPQGNLYCVDIPFGRVFRIDPRGEWDLVVQYDGWPNGLKIHKDGRIFIADYKRGLMLLDPQAGKSSRCSRPLSPRASRG
jgi:gluconolactonase